MAERKREIQVKFWVTPEEKKMIRKKMILSRTANMGAYLRKMAIDGIIVNTDTTYLEKQFFEMHKIGVNVNQLARHCQCYRFRYTGRNERIEGNDKRNMAYIKIFGIKSTVKKAVDYITNPAKTDEQNLVSSYGCSPETADLEFAMTAKLGKDNVMEKGDNLAWHMIISFKPGEITDPHIAHEVETKIADATLKGKHEYVLSTPIDKDHVHCHLIFNATNFVDYHKYVSNKRNYPKNRKLSNRICQEYGLEESMPTGQKAKSYKENMEYKRGNSWKAKLKYNVDRAIWSSVSFDEFLMKMTESGYEIRKGKYLAFRAPEQKHFTNVKTLGAYYAEDSILRRLERTATRSAFHRTLLSR